MNFKKEELITEVFDLGRNISAKQQDSELTMIQLRTVILVEREGIVRPTEIAKKFSITPASVTSQIDKLVEQGWLERKYNQDDKRVIEVVLTDKGKRQLGKLKEELVNNCSWIFKTLDKQELDTLFDLVSRLNKSYMA
ncbi:MAG: Transcriptional regulator, MarR family [candidate division WS6 bacterium 34_10]|jgi:DNA-binding MarR family transcriptional regulator|uniref:Transcriptional regulator, MarR family n=1 Tax=candidate division WS6 bacterium 34_10 TaxID=1641389 RepID=A0A101HIN1_9BACT|nr:MAG: Transcriptional regulator, MarR family [candidate division WS6 bacterium 34_10]